MNTFTVQTRLYEGVEKSKTLSVAVKEQLLGEAKFLRAFFYFYLVNLYGDVPLIISTDYVVNAKSSRTDLLQVYDQIVRDLIDAQRNLSVSYVSSERVRPNQSVATALLARDLFISRVIGLMQKFRRLR